MSPQAAQHYAQNPYDLLAAEGFGHDPTLQYQAYYGGGSGIPNPRTTNMSSWMQQNRWTPGGIQGGVNNPSMYANTAFGAGYDSYRAAAGLGDSTNTQTVANNKQPLPDGRRWLVWWRWWRRLLRWRRHGRLCQLVWWLHVLQPHHEPYLQQMGDMMAGTMTNNWQRKVQPQIASQSIAAGGYGGSRQGVAEANSANDLNMGIGSALANLYGQGYGRA